MWPNPTLTWNLFRIPYDIQCKIDVINNNIKYIKYIELQLF